MSFMFLSIPNERHTMFLLLLTVGLNKDQAEEIERIYYEFKNLMKVIALRYVRNESNADDIVQDSFFKIRDNLSKIISLPCKKKSSYIVNIVKSTSLDYLRKDKRYRKCIELRKKNYSYSEFDSKYEQDQLRVTIESIICQMDDKYSLPLILKYHYGYTTKEICEKLNIKSENTVSSIIYRGRREFIKLFNSDKTE